MLRPSQSVDEVPDDLSASAEIDKIFSKRPDVPSNERHLRMSHGFALLTNFIKSHLLERYCVVGADKVLDIGCGRGADARRYDSLSVQRYIGTDASSTLIRQGCDRMQLNRDHKNGIAVELRALRHSELLDRRIATLAPFAIISSFCSLQHVCTSNQLLQSTLLKISHLLGRDCYFVCTLPDGDRIRSLLNHNNGYIKRDLFEFKQPGGEFGAGNGDRRYLFTLHGSFVDLPEVAVRKDVLISLARSSGLQLVETFTFEELVDVANQTLAAGARTSVPSRAKNQRSFVEIGKRVLTVDERILSSCYRAVVFKKAVCLANYSDSATGIHAFELPGKEPPDAT